MPALRPLSTAACLLAAGLMLTGCKLVRTSEVASLKAEGAGGGAPAFDPDRMAAGLWASRALPYLRAKAGDFPAVRDLARRSPDEAGAKYGYRAKADGVPWTLVTRLDGRIVAANTASRAGTIEVDADGDGKPDATVQIGPAIRGTALRDSLDFVSFNDFTNQIDFARFGKAFNTLVDAGTLKALPRDALVGRSVSVLGAYPLADPTAVPLVTPAEITLGAGS